MGPSRVLIGTKSVTSIAVAAGALFALVACSSSGQHAQGPSARTHTTGVVVENGARSPGDPTGNTPELSGTTVSSGAPASQMEGACSQGSPGPNAQTAHDCIKSCRGLDEAVPTGSKCMSQYESCATKCIAPKR